MFKSHSCSGYSRPRGLEHRTHSPHIKRSSTVNWNSINDISCCYGDWGALQWVYQLASERERVYVSVCATAREQTHAYFMCAEHPKQQASGCASQVTQKTAASVSVSVWLTLIPGLLAHVVRLMKLSEKALFFGSLPAMKLRVMGWGSAPHSFAPSVAPTPSPFPTNGTVWYPL